MFILSSANPLVTSDNSLGYRPGDIWLNSSTGASWTNSANATGAAADLVAGCREFYSWFFGCCGTRQLTGSSRTDALALTGTLD